MVAEEMPQRLLLKLQTELQRALEAADEIDAVISAHICMALARIEELLG